MGRAQTRVPLAARICWCRCCVAVTPVIRRRRSGWWRDRSQLSAGRPVAGADPRRGRCPGRHSRRRARARERCPSPGRLPRWVGISLRRIQQGGLSPPGITHRLSQAVDQALGGCGRRRGTPGRSDGQSSTGRFPARQAVHWNRRRRGNPRHRPGGPDDAARARTLPDFFSGQVTQLPLHHRVGQSAQHRFFLSPASWQEVLGLLPPPQHDLQISAYSPARPPAAPPGNGAR